MWVLILVIFETGIVTQTYTTEADCKRAASVYEKRVFSNRTLADCLPAGNNIQIGTIPGGRK